MLRFHTYQKRYQTTQTKGQCDPSSCTTSQCQTSLILCWHAEPSQSNVPHHSNLLLPLTALTKKNSKFQWTTEHQQAFDSLKNSLAREVVLAYPDFSVPFEIYTNASKYQIGSVVTQKDKLRNNQIAKDIGFYTSVIPYTSPHPTPLECQHKEVLDLTWINVLFQNHFCSCQIHIKMQLGPIKNLLQWPSM